ncbi:YicC family protein [Halopseudomonas pachastrellae]|uniref:YicC family protein n=1 Tax=Halopseudomonas pachastrellae TaxID=254161 RepID=A0A1S8DKX1_9GAMM|nr:YicC/YloC family endoribonuclease [Halopseudomonas pachastrellae]ONM45641.1 YicC family protein [Halopseudomonas pachastrellae]SFM23857.1 TIGR00255 family protein [Halopseudomonas pachastrellae]
MANSMTAFARSELSTDQGNLAWELRSVNHRYLEVTLRLPEAFRELEGPLRELLRKQVARGKVECTLRFNPAEQQSSELSLNKPLLDQLIRTTEQLGARLHNAGPINPLELLAWPGVVLGEKTDQDDLVKQARSLFDQALKELKEHRAREGAELKQLIIERLDNISDRTAILREMMPTLLTAHRRKLIDRFNDAKLELDSTRVEQEIVLLAQKIDVAEELDRLDTHVVETRRVLDSKDAIGRRLDFLMQEFNREANTLGSKAIDTRSTQAAVDLKVFIEQMREQIQNIE